MRQEQQQNFLRQPGMMQNNMQYQTMLRMQHANGMQMNPNDMRQRAQQNLRNNMYVLFSCIVFLLSG